MDVCLLLVPTTQSISMLQARMKHGNVQYQAAPRREWSGNSSSTDSELEPQEARCSRQLDLAHYPELEEEVQRMEDYYLSEYNLHRTGVPLKTETWRKVQMHMLSECVCVWASTL